MSTITSTSSIYASSLSAQTLSSNLVNGNYTIHATSDRNVIIKSAIATTINSNSVNKCIYLGGAGVAGQYRCISFTTSGKADVTVFASGASGRKIALIGPDGSIIASQETDASVKQFIFNISNSGTYYIESIGSSISVYYIKTTITELNSSSNSNLNESISTSTSNSSSNTTSSINNAEVFPAIGSNNVYEDIELKINFKSLPSIGTGTVKVFDTNGSLVDTIKSTDEKLYCNTLSGTNNTIAVGNQMIYVLGNSVIIKLHNSSTGKSSVLSAGKTYFVQISSGLITVGGSSFVINDKSWTFTVRKEPSISNTITVGKTGKENFYTIQGAFNYLMTNNKSGDFTINVSGGKYYEFLHYNNTTNFPNVKIVGDLNDIPQIHWKNAYPMATNDGTIKNANGGARTRSTFLWQGGNLTLKYLKFFNDYDISNGGNLQAETLAFDKTGKFLAAYKCKFSSYQDTLYFGINTKCWFYDCEIVGDVDTVWGYADVALFEKSTFSIASLSKDPSSKNYEFESRIGYKNTSNIFGKGFVTLNCTVKTGKSSEEFYLGRRTSSSLDYYDQIAWINPSFDSLSTKGWYIDSSKSFNGVANGSNILIGLNTYGVTGVSANTSKYIGILSNAIYKSEYANRSVILNRSINKSSLSYVSSPNIWNYASIESDFLNQTSSSTTNNSSTNGTSSSSSTFNPNEKPTGFASINASSKFGGYGGTEVTVSNRADFIKYAKTGGYVIYVNGTIDLSDGMIPTSGGESTTKLDNLVKSNSNYSNYSAFKNAYTSSCSYSTDDKSSSSPQSSLGSILWKLNKLYGNTVKVTVGSNTTIIGKSGAVIKGGSLILKNVNNIAIRNISFKDAYDPFPHHEKNDGFNAEFDLVLIQNSHNIWVDHCTFEDTMDCTNVKTSSGTEKWQTYDDLLDINGDSYNITESYNIFRNHDKTCLFGSSDTESVSVTRTVTINNNYYYNCGQRLPMIRIANAHIYNNYYDASNPHYQQKYGVQPRSKSCIILEGCYFGSGIKYSIAGASATKTAGTVSSTKVYVSQISDNSPLKTQGNGTYYTTVTSKPFTIPYYYSLKDANSIVNDCKSNAGAK